MNAVPKYFRRKEAGGYVRSEYGFGSPSVLAKLAVTGGGPEFFYAGRIPLYTQAALDAWAQAKISSPVRSTAGRKTGPKSGQRPEAAE